MLKNIIISTPLLLLSIQPSYANEEKPLYTEQCYRSYNLSHDYKVTTRIENNIHNENENVSGNLHIRKLRNQKDTKQLSWIIWLQDKSNPEKIDFKSIHSPFIISSKGNGFFISDIATYYQDEVLRKMKLGLMDTFQYRPFNSKNPEKTINAEGFVSSLFAVNEKDMSVTISRFDQLDAKNKKSNLKILQSKSFIEQDENCFIKQATTNEVISSSFPALKTKTKVEHLAKLEKSKDSLSRDHWFFKLGADIGAWVFPTEVVQDESHKISADESIKLFKSISEDEIQKVVKGNDFKKWIDDNKNILENFDSLLEELAIDDDFLMGIMAELGYIDTPFSVEVLGKIVINTSIAEKERFRAAMGLKNTSAPIPDDILQSMLDTGLKSYHEDDFLDNAVGMLSGTFARERFWRVPSQAEYISTQVASEITSSSGENLIALAAAGNMHDGAPDKIVNSVDNVLNTSTSASSRRESADALTKIGRTALTVSTFESLWSNENNRDAKERIIQASAVSSDAKDNPSYHNSLLNIVKDRHQPKAIRVSALDALEKVEYGRKQAQKQLLRTMLLGEADRDVQAGIKKLYRAP